MFELLLSSSKMLSPLLKFYVDLLVDLLQLVNLFLQSYAILFQYVIDVSALFTLVELESGLQLVNQIILFGHLLSQHFQTFLFLFALDLLSSVVLFDLVLQDLFRPF
jgi:hypothetical protein